MKENSNPLIGRTMYGYTIDNATGYTPGYAEFTKRAGIRNPWAAPIDALDAPVWRQFMRLRGEGWKPVIAREARGHWTGFGWTRARTAADIADECASLYSAPDDCIVYGSFGSSFTIIVGAIDAGTGVVSVSDSQTVCQISDEEGTRAASVMQTPALEAPKFDELEGGVLMITMPRNLDDDGLVFDDLVTWGLSAYRPQLLDPYDALCMAVLGGGDGDIEKATDGLAPTLTF